jgi:predicted Zn-dependent peptidase
MTQGLADSFDSDDSGCIRQHRFDNGFTVVHEAMPWLPSVSFTLLVPVGAATDPEGLEGSATVLREWLERGTMALSSQEYSEQLDDLGVRRGGGAGKEYATFSASLLAEAFEPTLTLYAQMLRTPRLADDEFFPARALATQELAALADNPSQQLFEALSERYFASSHKNSSYGTAEGLAALTPAALREDCAARVAPKGVILSVAGGVAWEAVMQLAERLFGDWQGEGVALPAVRLSAVHQAHIMQETSQVHIGVAFETVAPGAPGWYENALATGILSGGMGARLFTEVREKRGLVYSVAAVSRAVRGLGYTLSYAGTTTERADATLEVLLGELSKLSRGVSAAELERSRTGLLSQLVMQGESSGARAAALARDTYLLGVPRAIDDVKETLLNLDLEAVNRYLAERYAPAFTILTLGAKPLAEVAR